MSISGRTRIDATNLTALFILCAATLLVTSCRALYSQQSPANFKVTGIAKGRFEISSTTKQLKLAEPNEIAIQMHGFEAHSSRASLKYLDNNGSSAGFEGYTELVFKYHEDGSRYFNITPQKLGKLQIIITVIFNDGRIEIEKIDDLEVVPVKM